MSNRLVLGWLIAAIGIGLVQGGHVVLAQPTFRTGVELVSVTAVVSDGRGRPVRALTRDDFQVFDDGERRPVVEFWADDAAALSLALLFDVSGGHSLFASGAMQRFHRDIHAATHHTSLAWDNVAGQYGRVRLGLEPGGVDL